MSTNVLVIPEDFRKDEGILKPLVKAMMSELGKPRSKVLVCRDPLLQGISQALSEEKISGIVERYKGMVDLFLLCVDRDGEAGRRTRLDQIEAAAGQALPAGKALIAENAWQEIEVWVLAGHDDLPADWNWNDVRAERDSKEKYFLPFAGMRGLLNAPGEGRKLLAEEAARRFDRIRQLCPEDVANLENRVRERLGGSR